MHRAATHPLQPPDQPFTPMNGAILPCGGRRRVVLREAGRTKAQVLRPTQAGDQGIATEPMSPADMLHQGIAQHRLGVLSSNLAEAGDLIGIAPRKKHGVEGQIAQEGRDRTIDMEGGHACGPGLGGFVRLKRKERKERAHVHFLRLRACLGAE